MTEVIAALIRDGARFLACRRPAHKARGGLWEFPGGKVEPGESREECLVRECREELGVELAPGGLYMELVHEYPDLTVHLYVYEAQISSGTPQLLEHSEIRWVTAEETLSMSFCPADKDSLAALRKEAGL